MLCVFLASPSPLCIHPYVHTLLPASESPEQSSVQLPESSIMMVSKYHVPIRIKKLGPALMHWTSLTETNEDRSNANNKNNTINDCAGIMLIYTIEDCSNTGRRFMLQTNENRGQARESKDKSNILTNQNLQELDKNRTLMFTYYLSSLALRPESLFKACGYDASVSAAIFLRLLVLTVITYTITLLGLLDNHMLLKLFVLLYTTPEKSMVWFQPETEITSGKASSIKTGDASWQGSNR